MPETLSAPAPAKINLTLEVLGKRPDGYHEIDTILQALALADTVSLTFGGTPGVSATGPYAAGTPEDASNLAWRAAEHLAAATGHSTADLHIHLEKRIPAAGGLGGGASDAATTLRLLQRRWNAPESAVRSAALAVGSDEAFFLHGGTARAQGRGEEVTPLPPLPPHGVVLFIPPGTIERKTATMFRALAGHPFDDGAATRSLAAALPRTIDSRDVHNAFERVAFDVFPPLAALWERLEQRTARPIRLAGAGPTLFWIGPPEQAAAIAASAAGEACAIIETSTVHP